MIRPLAIAAAALLMSACAAGLVGDAFRPPSYIIRPGDTLYSIAWRYQIDHEALMRWNGIEDPRSIQPGLRLRLHPVGDRRAATRDNARQTTGSAAANTATRSTGSRASGSDSTRSEATARPPEKERSADTGGAGPGRWRWPTAGRVVGTFGNGRVAGRGIDIAGDPGQSIEATAAGEVVYSGDGLKAYGRLLIIRHGGDFLSAYAHNADLLVAEGDRVEAGDRIARMGRTNDGQALLHFEIRQSGQPVDPIRYLPTRD